MPPFSADVGKAVPLPRGSESLGLLHGIQSIEVKYFQEYVFGEHFNQCPPPPPILPCSAWVSNSKVNYEREVWRSLELTSKLGGRSP